MNSKRKGCSLEGLTWWLAGTGRPPCPGDSGAHSAVLAAERWACTVPTTEMILKQMLVLNATAFRLPQYHNINKGDKKGKHRREKKKTMTRIRSRKEDGNPSQLTEFSHIKSTFQKGLRVQLLVIWRWTDFVLKF